MHVGSSMRASTPNARAERAISPRFSGSLSPSSTATRRDLRDDLVDARQGQALRRGDHAAVEVETDGAGDDVFVGDEDLGIGHAGQRFDAPAVLRRDEDRADPVR